MIFPPIDPDSLPIRVSWDIFFAKKKSRLILEAKGCQIEKDFFAKTRFRLTIVWPSTWHLVDLVSIDFSKKQQIKGN